MVSRFSNVSRGQVLFGIDPRIAPLCIFVLIDACVRRVGDVYVRRMVFSSSEIILMRTERFEGEFVETGKKYPLARRQDRA